ncbi:hypothetical protein T439DRAFT_358977 [Meredithblackwellia eburnea MCA 4105]
MKFLTLCLALVLATVAAAYDVRIYAPSKAEACRKNSFVIKLNGVSESDSKTFRLSAIQGGSKIKGQVTLVNRGTRGSISPVTKDWKNPSHGKTYLRLEGTINGKAFKKESAYFPVTPSSKSC